MFSTLAEYKNSFTQYITDSIEPYWNNTKGFALTLAEPFLSTKITNFYFAWILLSGIMRSKPPNTDRIQHLLNGFALGSGISIIYNTLLQEEEYSLISNNNDFDNNILLHTFLITPHLYTLFGSWSPSTHLFKSWLPHIHLDLFAPFVISYFLTQTTNFFFSLPKIKFLVSNVSGISFFALFSTEFILRKNISYPVIKSALEALFYITGSLLLPHLAIKILTPFQHKGYINPHLIMCGIFFGTSYTKSIEPLFHSPTAVTTFSPAIGYALSTFTSATAGILLSNFIAYLIKADLYNVILSLLTLRTSYAFTKSSIFPSSFLTLSPKLINPLFILTTSFLSLISGNYIVKYLLPINELKQVSNALSLFLPSQKFSSFSQSLISATISIQLILPYIGLKLMRIRQQNQYNLPKIATGDYTAVDFIKDGKYYILVLAFPYMILRTLGETLNKYYLQKFTFFAQNEFRLNQAFTNDNFNKISHANLTLSDYTESITDMISKSHLLLENKIYAIPKLALLSATTRAQSTQIFKILPLIFITDFIASWILSGLTNYIEDLKTTLDKKQALQTKVEQHDSTNSFLIIEQNLQQFTKDRYATLLRDIQFLELKISILEKIYEMASWLYNSEILYVTIYFILAILLQQGIIQAAETFIYTRAIEDAIDLIFTRSRNRSELESINHGVEKLIELKAHLDKDTTYSSFHQIPTPSLNITINNLKFSRIKDGEKKVAVKIPTLSLEQGKVYAIVGPNGSGKSSLFKIISGDIDSTFDISDGTVLSNPNVEIVLLNQKSYCPLYVKPLDWILEKDSNSIPENQKRDYKEKILRLTKELGFYTSGNIDSFSRDKKCYITLSAQEFTNPSSPHKQLFQQLPYEEQAGLLRNFLSSGPDNHVEVEVSCKSPIISSESDLEDKRENWYNELSGGQISKIEFIKKIFLKDVCPEVLLIDETFAPLDSEAKNTIQQKLRIFCKDSILLVIHHTDANTHCVESQNFFDDVIKFGTDGIVSSVGTCETQNATKSYPTQDFESQECSGLPTSPDYVCDAEF